VTAAAELARRTVTLDPHAELYPIPTYPWRGAPDGYATRRQLSAQGLRPNGQHPAAQVIRHRRGRAERTRGPLVGYLYRVDLAAPKRPATPAIMAAVRAAVRARQTCHECGRWVGYVPPLITGRLCLDCAGYPSNPGNTGGDLA
jgi:hypothetical protein